MTGRGRHRLDLRSIGLATGDWRRVGAVAYYAFDNAVVWAAFHAYGNPPPLGVIAPQAPRLRTHDMTWGRA